MATLTLESRPAAQTALPVEPTDEAKLLLTYRASLLRELAEVDRRIAQVAGF